MEKIELLVKYESDIISGKRFGAVDKCIDYIFNSFIISGSGIKEFKIIKANTRDSILIHKLMKLFHIDNLNVVNNNQDMRFSNVLMGRHGLCRDRKMTEKRLAQVENVAL